MNMSKLLKVFLVGLLSVLLMTACGGEDDTSTDDTSSDDTTTEDTSDDTTDEKEDVTLTFWEFGNTGYDVLIEEYMEANPHVTVELQNMDQNDLHDNLFTSLSAGSGAPDVTMVEVNQLERYRDAQDRFHNLKDYGADDVEGNFLDWVWKTGENADGSFMFGLPTDIGPTVMYYRTDVFEEAGLESSPEAVGEMIQTWEDFETVAQEIYAETGKQMTDGAELIFNARRDQAPEHFFNTDDELIVEEHDYIRNAYDYTVSLIEQDLVGDIQLWTPEWFAGMGEGSYATLLGPAWMQGVIKDNAEPGVWSITTLPEGAGNWGGSYLTVPAESEHPEEAYAFVEWMTAPEQQLKSFLDYGLFPSAPAVYEDPEFLDYTDEFFGGIKTAQVFSEAAEAVVPVYKGKGYYTVNDVLQEAVSNVNAGADPDEEWNAAIEQAKSALARQ